MFLSNKEFKLFVLLLCCFLSGMLILTLSDAASDLNQTSKVPMRNEEGTIISSALIPGKSPELVIFATDFSTDQVQYKSMKREFYHAGYSTLTFDFTGQGRSWGSLPLPSPHKPDATREMQFAKDLHSVEKNILSTGIFSEEMGLNYVGHGEGATALLKATAHGWIHPKHLVLISPEDDWNTVATLRGKKLPCAITLITSTADEICPPSQLNEFESWLNADLAEEQKNKITIQIVKGVPHLYAVQSPQIINRAIEAIETEKGFTTRPLFNPYPYFRIIATTLAFLGLILSALILLIKKREPTQGEFLSRWELLFTAGSWSLGGILAIGIMVALYFTPIPKPLTILTLPILIGCYGFIKTLFYHFSPTKWGLREIGNELYRFKTGLMNRQQRIESFRSGIALAALWLLTLLLTFRLSICWIIPFNLKQFWFLFLLLFTFPAFYSAALEVYHYSKNRRSDITLSLIRWIPFILLPLSFLTAGKLTGALLQIQHLILLITILLLGRLQIKAKVSPIQIAFLQALIYSILLVPQSALLI